MSKQKRMIYVYEENLDFYNSLENKSQFFNDALQDARINDRVKDEPVDNPKTIKLADGTVPDPRIADITRQVEAMHDRDLKALKASRGE